MWEMMDVELDERLLQQGLVGKDLKEPSLHIRRTLDQSYFLTLEDTTKRDRDQVVYRETQLSWTTSMNVTRVVMVDQLWLWILDEREQQPSQSLYLPPPPLTNIIPWHQDTIITSFPRRWGRNKPDSSGIHKSLRDRLAHMDGEIHSVWHLGEHRTTYWTSYGMSPR